MDFAREAGDVFLVVESEARAAIRCFIQKRVSLSMSFVIGWSKYYEPTDDFVWVSPFIRPVFN